MDNRKAIPPFSALRAFEAVGRFKGVRRAAAALQVDHAIVSRQVRALESWTGVRLVDRAKGGLRLTSEGEAYSARLSAAFGDIVKATADLMADEEGRPLRVWCAPGLALKWLAPRLMQLRHRYPQLEIELRPSDQPADLGNDEADIDIRYVLDDMLAIAPPPGIARIELARPCVFPVVGASMAEQGSSIGAANDLLTRPLLHEENDHEWRSWFAAQSVDVEGRLPGYRLWHAHLCLDAAIRGEGCALANNFLVHDDLTSARLQRVEGRDPWNNCTLGSYVLTALSDKWTSTQVRRFRHWLGNVMENDMRRWGERDRR